MSAEERLVEFVRTARFEEIPLPAMDIVKNQVLAIAGTTIAGATADGCEAAVRFYRELGGKPEATILIHGGKVPAQDAAFVNAVMGRALDFCDSMAPGPHPGAAIFPAALSAAELMGGCSGRAFITAVAVGTEVATRLNLSEAAYDGFDPTGICVPFGATAAASRILGLNLKQTWDALALAFNNCGGSFQSHVDGSLGVRFVQGRVAQSALLAVRLAREGITGPKNFLDGVYGYFHLYAKDMLTGETATSGLGTRYDLTKLVFKKYPSCALTGGSTEVMLKLMAEEKITVEDVERIEIAVPPYTHKLVGHDFRIGENPKVNAQFSIQYCVANALIRGASKLIHFEDEYIRDPRIMELTKRINVIPEKSLEARGHSALDMRVVSRSGREYTRSLDIAPGFPGNSLNKKEHGQRFWDCVDFAGDRMPRENGEKIAALIDAIDTLDDIRRLIPLFASPGSP